MLTLLDVANEVELPFTEAQFTLLAAAFVDDEWGPHQMCSLVACRLPLHPGPCKGWKHTLHLTAPGVYHALESSRVEKANAKRLAKIEALKKAGKKVPSSLLKPITYSLPKPPPEHQIGQHAEVVGGEAHKAAHEANKSAGIVEKHAPKLHDEKLSTAGTDAAEQAKDTLGEQAKPKGKPAGVPKKVTPAKVTQAKEEVGKHTLGEAVKAGTTQGVFEKPATGETLVPHYSTLSKDAYEALTPEQKKAVMNRVAHNLDKGTAAQKQAATDFLNKIGGNGPKPAEPSKVGIKGEGVVTLKTVETPKPEPVKQHQGVATADAVTGKPHADFLDSFAKMTAKDYADLPLGDRIKVRQHLQTISLHGNPDNAAKASKLSLALHQVAEMKPGTTFGEHDSAMKAPVGKGYNVKQNAAVNDVSHALSFHDKAKPNTTADTDAVKSIGAMLPSEFSELSHDDQKSIKSLLQKVADKSGPFANVQDYKGASAHAILEKLNNSPGHDEEVSPGVKATLDQVASQHPAVKAFNDVVAKHVPKESVNALSEEAKKAGGTSVNAPEAAKVTPEVTNAAPGKLSEKAQAAHNLANSKGFVMSKAHLETYEPLSKDDFVSLDPATQTTIKAQLAVALTKLKDPKKLAATQTLLDKFIDATGGPGTAKPLPAAEAAKIAEKTVEAAPKIDAPAGYTPAQVKAKLALLSASFDDDTVLDHVWNLSKADLNGMTADEKQALIDKVTEIKSKPGQHVVTSSVASKLLKKWDVEPVKAEEPKAPEVKPEPVKISHVDVPELDTSGNTWPGGYTDDMKQAATMAHEASKGTGPSLTFQQKATIVDKLTADDWAKLKESHKAKLITQINQMDESGVKGVDGLRERFGLAKPGGASPYKADEGKAKVAKPIPIIAPSAATSNGGHLDQIKSPDFADVGTGNAWPAIKELTPAEYKALPGSTQKVIDQHLANVATHDPAAVTKAHELGASLPEKQVAGNLVPGHYHAVQAHAANAPENDKLYFTDQLAAIDKLTPADFKALTPEHQAHIDQFLDHTKTNYPISSPAYQEAVKIKAVLHGESGSKAKAETLKSEAAKLAGNAVQQKADAIEQVHAALGKQVTPFDEETIGKLYRSAMVKGAKDALFYGTSGKWQAKQSIKDSPLKAQINEDVKALYDKTEALAIAHAHAHAGTPGAAEKLKTAEAEYKAAHAKADATVAQIRKDAGLATKHIPQWNAKPNLKFAADEAHYKVGGYQGPLHGHGGSYGAAAQHYLLAKLGDKNAITTHTYSSGGEKQAAEKLKEAADLEKNADFYDAQAKANAEAHKLKAAQGLVAKESGGSGGGPNPATASALGVHYMPAGAHIGTGGYGTSAFDGKSAYVAPDYAAWVERAQEATNGNAALKYYKSIAEMSGSTKAAFVDYTANSYEHINQELMKAGPGGTVTGKAKTLKDAYKSLTPADTDVVLFRGMRRMSKKFGAAANDTNMVGASFDQLGASSTSVAQSTADNFAHLGEDPFVMRILLRHGQKIRGISAAEGGSHTSEVEVILEPGMRYTVVADYGVVDGRRRFDVVAERIPTVG